MNKRAGLVMEYECGDLEGDYSEEDSVLFSCTEDLVSFRVKLCDVREALERRPDMVGFNDEEWWLIPGDKTVGCEAVNVCCSKGELNMILRNWKENWAEEVEDDGEPMTWNYENVQDWDYSTGPFVSGHIVDNVTLYFELGIDQLSEAVNTAEETGWADIVPQKVLKCEESVGGEEEWNPIPNRVVICLSRMIIKTLLAEYRDYSYGNSIESGKAVLRQWFDMKLREFAVTLNTEGSEGDPEAYARELIRSWEYGEQL